VEGYPEPALQQKTEERERDANTGSTHLDKLQKLNNKILKSSAK